MHFSANIKLPCYRGVINHFQNGALSMTTKKKIAGVIAAAAAIAFVTAPIASSLALAHSKKVPCYGVNSCKGKGKCNTAGGSCKGKNDCKGKGVVMKTPKQCKKAGGTTDEPKS